MTEIEEQEKRKPLRLSRPGKLELKKTVEGGQVRQKFSHGRSKVVAVEVRKKRSYALDDAGEMTKVRSGALGEAGDAAISGDPLGDAGESIRGLTEHEKAARARALNDAIRAGESEAAKVADAVEAAEAVFADQTVGKPPVEAAPDLVLDEAELQRKAGEEETERRAAAEAERKAEEEESQRREEQAKAAAAHAVAKLKAVGPEAEETDDRARGRRPGRPVPRRPGLAARRGEPRRRGGRLTITEALSDEDERTRSLAAVRRAREREKKRQAGLAGETQKVVRDVIIPETITVQELASRMAERGVDVVRALMKMGVMATVTQSIDGDTAELIATEHGHNVKRVSESDVELGLAGALDEEEDLISRPPVVTVMGHVDHGKTSLLDALRSTDVVAGEAGGITQHIGAYQVTLPSGGKITFLDTPGHAAFTAMRARGAEVTDIVVLVVAADDGIMPQTIEAIDHAKAASVPIIVAINKIDLPDADSSRIRTDLLQHELVLEEMGGDVLAVEVSAIKKTNLDKLEEAILLQSEVLELTANPKRPGEGTIVEARIDRGRGSVATVLVSRGTLRIGDIFVAGAEWGRVRALLDDHGNSIEEALPGMPVEILGLSGTPEAGDDFVVAESEASAREISEYRRRKQRDARNVSEPRGTVEQMLARIQEGETEELPVIIKGDVHGSVEAIGSALENLGTDEVKVRVLHSAVGGINESDVTLAAASEALIIGFNVRANPQARDLAKRDGVDIRYYAIIYNVVDEIRQALSGMLSPTMKENILGYSEIREVFSITKAGKVAGCMVSEGQVRRGAKVRLLRDDVVIHDGAIGHLKRFKDDVREVREGFECGMSFENYQDIRVGDRIECYEVEEVTRSL